MPPLPPFLPPSGFHRPLCVAINEFWTRRRGIYSPGTPAWTVPHAVPLLFRGNQHLTAVFALNFSDLDLLFSPLHFFSFVPQLHQNRATESLYPLIKRRGFLCHFACSLFCHHCSTFLETLWGGNDVWSHRQENSEKHHLTPTTAFWYFPKWHRGKLFATPPSITCDFSDNLASHFWQN